MLLHQEIEILKKRILSLGAEVEENVHQAITSIKTRDLTLTEKVIGGDDVIDREEVDVEEECLKVLALYQPVAIDLRFIVAILKMNSDLERIGDLAVNIAIRSGYLAHNDKIEIPRDFFELAEHTASMFRKSLDALVNFDSRLALDVCASDDHADDLYRSVQRQMKDRMTINAVEIKRLLRLMEIAHHFERIADHATNIAEDVIYMVHGRIIRHGAHALQDG